jgi:hypothetical protein
MPNLLEGIQAVDDFISQILQQSGSTEMAEPTHQVVWSFGSASTLSFLFPTDANIVGFQWISGSSQNAFAKGTPTTVPAGAATERFLDLVLSSGNPVTAKLNIPMKAGDRLFSTSTAAVVFVMSYVVAVT